jgi:hypothetical protein
MHLLAQVLLYIMMDAESDISLTCLVFLEGRYLMRYRKINRTRDFSEKYR